MYRRSAVAAIAALGTILFAAGILGAGTASAAPAAGPAPVPPSTCNAVYFDLSFGQGVDVFCDQAPGTYQVVAQCNDGAHFWSSLGTLTVADSAPSVAECHGELLSPAQVVSYYVLQ